MRTKEQENILFDLELRVYLLMTKFYPTQVDLDNVVQLNIIIKQLEKLWK